MTAGYLFGARSGRAVREELRAQCIAHTNELTRLRERVSEQREGDEKLRDTIERVLAPLVHRDQLAFDLSHLESSRGQQRDLTALLDQIAEKGNFSAVLLGDEQGLPLAASSAARNLDRLGATSSLMLLLADRLTRDGTPAPLSLMVHDAANGVTLCRLFHVDNQRLSLTAVSVGDQLSPAALDPALAKLDSVLLARSEPTRQHL